MTINEHDHHPHVITVTLEENEVLVSLMQACRESMAATREMFNGVDLTKLSAREFQLLRVTTAQLQAMEEVLRVLVPLFLRAESKPEVIQ